MADSQDLKVIWVSLPQMEIVVYKRTLNLLGYTSYTSADIFSNPDHIAIWKEILLKRKPLDVSLFENYDASAQTLPTSFYLQMIEQFPHAKFIIEDMPPRVWAGRYKRMNRMLTLFGWVRLFPKTRAFLQVIQYIIYPITKGVNSRIFLENVYMEFKETIIREVPKSKLLVFNPDDGWQPICDFLEKPTPNAALPLRGNKNQETNNFVRRIVLTTLGSSNNTIMIALYFIVLISIFVYLIFFY